MEQKQECVTHSGVIEQIETNKIVVRVVSASACAACHAKGSCSAADLADKYIDVKYYEPHTFKVGETVEVFMEKSLGTKAVFLGYVLPFLVLLSTLIVTLYFTGNEGLSALAGLLILAPYYITLYLFRDKLARQFVFRIR